MATMTHTKEQRRAWHAGKRQKNESVVGWVRRVINKARNFAGAYTPSRMKSGILFSNRRR